mmetsp:Transcript_26260/g.58981  ORF Transcript_26260/g.58981 Transcript_26260/m.58981 type:complete len:354 (+) Transcript_26260:173-1234(+)
MSSSTSALQAPDGPPSENKYEAFEDREPTPFEQFAERSMAFAEWFEMPYNPLVDFSHDIWGEGLLFGWKFAALSVHNVALVAIVTYFVYTAYVDGVTSSFISIDPKAGVCRGEANSQTCCEVPQSITGTFLADTQGKWNTEPGFNPVNGNYAVTVVGLEYTNKQWTEVMESITAQMKAVGERGADRDLSWNLIAWSSFSAHNVERGSLRFYATGKASVIFSKPVRNMGFAAAASQENECSVYMVPFFNPSTSHLTVDVKLCDSGTCDNPCPGVLAPQAMGYDSFASDEGYMKLTVDMQAVSTAIAVNLNMTKLNNLVQVPADADRTNLLQDMVDYGYLTQEQMQHTSSYFDFL